MTASTVTITIPQPLYQRLERLAGFTQRPVERVLAQALAATLPLLPDDLPEPTRAQLIQLEQLSDNDLWAATQAIVPSDVIEQFNLLRASPRWHPHRSRTRGDRHAYRRDRTRHTSQGVCGRAPSLARPYLALPPLDASEA